MPAPTRERIALAVVELNGGDYCLSAHTYLGKNLAKLDDAVKVVQTRGHIADGDLSTVKSAGYNDAQIIEIVQHVALNTWTNYINPVAKTDIEFPVVHAFNAI